jgi:hypothetical protein
LKNILFLLILCSSLSSCSWSIEAYIIREYYKLPLGLSKKTFQKIVDENNQGINSESGFFRIYNLVDIKKSTRRKFYFEDNFFKDLYAKKKDSILIYSNLSALSSNNSIKGRFIVPSVFLELYSNPKNPNWLNRGIDHNTQLAVRDSMNKYLNPILKVSRYKLNPDLYGYYKFAMRTKRANQKKSNPKNETKIIK